MYNTFSCLRFFVCYALLFSHGFGLNVCRNLRFQLISKLFEPYCLDSWFVSVINRLLKCLNNVKIIA